MIASDQGPGKPALPIPPTAKLYVAHIAALLEVATFLENQWFTFRSILREPVADSPEEEEVAKLIDDVASSISAYATRVIWYADDTTDEIYHREVAELEGGTNAVAKLAEVVAICRRDRAHDPRIVYSDATAGT